MDPEVAGRSDDPALRDRDSSRPDANGKRELRDLLVAEAGADAGIVCPAEQALVALVDQVEDRAVAADEALRRIDDLLEERAGLTDCGDPGGDLAEGLLGVGSPGQLVRASD